MVNTMIKSKFHLHQNLWRFGWRSQSVPHNSLSHSTFHMNEWGHESVQASVVQGSAKKSFKCFQSI